MFKFFSDFPAFCLYFFGHYAEFLTKQLWGQNISRYQLVNCGGGKKDQMVVHSTVDCIAKIIFKLSCTNKKQNN
jgi:hypothetical protein